VQEGWSSVAIEQHGDAGGTTAHGDHDAILIGQVGTPNGAEIIYLETNTHCNFICFQNHGSGLAIKKKYL
jgi:hypothetical protein